MRSESPPEPDRPRAVAPHAGALSLVVVSAVLLGIALKRPTVFFQGLGGPEEIYSIYGGTESLWKDGNRVSATIVFAFSIVFPVGKLAFLAFCCLRGHVRKRSGRVLRTLVVLGKWSMVDVFIIALFVGSFLPIVYGHSSSRTGIHLFAVAIFLSMVAARMVQRKLAGEAAPVATQSGVTWRLRSVLSLAGLVLLGLGLREFYYLIKPPYLSFFKNEIGLLPTLRLLWNGDEARMAAYLAVFILAMPVLRGLSGLLLGCVRRPWMRRLAERVDEWAMLDVFVLALALVYDKLVELTDTTLLVGFWYLAAAAAVAEIDAFLIRRDRKRGESASHGTS